MQDNGPVAWDPISVRYIPPWALRLFVLYVLVVFAVAFVRSLRLSTHLWLFPNRKLARLKQATEQESPSAITIAALAGNFREILKADLGRHLLSSLRQAEGDFLYLWQLYLLKAQSIKKLAVLTILVSFWVFVMRAAEMFSQIGIQKVASIGLVSGVMVENLTSLELGTVVAMLLYAQYAVLEGVLRRRKIAWDFVVKAAELTTQ
jgi:hypothetical protein